MGFLCGWVECKIFAGCYKIGKSSCYTIYGLFSEKVKVEFMEKKAGIKTIPAFSLIARHENTNEIY